MKYVRGNKRGVHFLKILLDEHDAGLKEYLEALKWEIITAQEANLSGAEDRKIVEYAQKHNLILVTRDEKPAQIAKMLDVKYVWISSGVIAKVVNNQIREKYL